MTQTQPSVASLRSGVETAHADFMRFRDAYRDIEPGHEVALAMIGMDMDRAMLRWSSCSEALARAERAAHSQEPTAFLHKSNCGLYRDGGLTVIRHNRCTCGAVDASN